ncbi:MAG TPA: hypothetical protein VEC14_07825 [Reyranellaceae bacterium]|nr:hypothetical protein [Reyranellaceae bacterium]
MPELALFRIIDAPGNPLRLTVLQPHIEGGPQYAEYPMSDEALLALAGEVLKAAAKRFNRSQPHPSDSDQPVAVRE